MNSSPRPWPWSFPTPWLRLSTEAWTGLPYLSVVLYQEKSGRYVYLPLEPQDAPTAAAWLARRTGTPLYFIDRDTEEYPRRRDPLPDSYTVTRLGLCEYAEAYRREFADVESDPEDNLREMQMAWRLQQLAREHESVLCVIGLAHYPAVRNLLDRPLTRPIARTKREGVVLGNLAEESSREIMSEAPFLAAAFVHAVQGEDEDLDRLNLHREIIDQARAKYEHEYKEEMSPAQLAVLNTFARNYALVQGKLTPDLYQLIVAARGAADDNFAYEVWDKAVTYPWQDKESGLPEIKITAEDLFMDSRRLQFHRRFRQMRRRLVAVPVRNRPREKKPVNGRKVGAVSISVRTRRKTWSWKDSANT